MNTITIENKESSDLSFAPRYIPSAKVSIKLIFSQIIALIIFRYDLFTTFNTNLIGGFSGDGGLYYWLVRHNAEYFLKLPWFHTLSFYPYGETLSWSDNFLFPALIFAFFRLIISSDIIAYNTVITIGMLLNGICMSRLCYRLVGSCFPAIVAGSFFIGSSYLASVIGHPQLQFAFVFPLFTELLLDFYTSKRLLTAFTLGALITISFLTTVYYAIFLIILAGILFIGILLQRPKALDRPSLFKLIVGGLLGIAPIIFFIFPYLNVRETFGAKFLYEPYFFSSSLRSFFSAPYSSLLYYWTSSFSHDEGHLFFGITPIILSIPLIIYINQARQLKKLAIICLSIFLSLVFASYFQRIRVAELISSFLSYASLMTAMLYLYRLGFIERSLNALHLTQRSVAALFLFTGLCSFCILLGPLGNSAHNEWALGVHHVLFSTVPGFNSIRAISRIGILVIFSVAILLAISIKFIQKKYQLNHAWMLLVSIMPLTENLNFSLIKEPAVNSPAVFENLRNISNINEAVIVLPFTTELDKHGKILKWGDFAKINVSAMNWALEAKVRTINGYSGQQSKVMNDLPREIVDFPSARAIKALKSFLHLKYIVYVPHFKRDFNINSFELLLNNYKDDLRVLEKDTQGNYLIELIGARIVEEDFHIFTPPYPNNELVLELNFGPKSLAKEAVLDIYTTKHIKGAPYKTIEIKKTAQAQTFSISLPDSRDSVRPVRFILRSRNRVPVIIKLAQTK